MRLNCDCVTQFVSKIISSTLVSPWSSMSTSTSFLLKSLLQRFWFPQLTCISEKLTKDFYELMTQEDTLHILVFTLTCLSSQKTWAWDTYIALAHRFTCLSWEKCWDWWICQIRTTCKALARPPVCQVLANPPYWAGNVCWCETKISVNRFVYKLDHKNHY